MKQISDQQFNEVLEKKGLFLIDIYADWCGPCKRLTPILEALSKEYSEDEVSFLKLNADEGVETCAKLSIRGIPVVVVIKDGQIKEMLMGVKSSDEYKEVIAKLKN